MEPKPGFRRFFGKTQKNKHIFSVKTRHPNKKKRQIFRAQTSRRSKICKSLQKSAAQNESGLGQKNTKNKKKKKKKKKERKKAFFQTSLSRDHQPKVGTETTSSVGGETDCILFLSLFCFSDNNDKKSENTHRQKKHRKCTENAALTKQTYLQIYTLTLFSLFKKK